MLHDLETVVPAYHGLHAGQFAVSVAMTWVNLALHRRTASYALLPPRDLRGRAATPRSIPAGPRAWHGMVRVYWQVLLDMPVGVRVGVVLSEAGRISQVGLDTQNLAEQAVLGVPAPWSP